MRADLNRRFGDIHARKTAQHIIDRGRLPAVDILTRHNSSWRKHSAARLFKTVSSNDESIRLVSCAQAENAVTEHAVSSEAFLIIVKHPQ